MSNHNFEISVVYKYWLSEHNLKFFESLPKFDCRDLYFEKKKNQEFYLFFFFIGSHCNAAFPMTVFVGGEGQLIPLPTTSTSLPPHQPHQPHGLHRHHSYHHHTFPLCLFLIGGVSGH